MTESVLFYCFSLLALVAAGSVVVQRSPIASALSLVVCFFALAADYVLLDAHFVAVI
jgi:NADH-quinone oxidoreductase subunit J